MQYSLNNISLVRANTSTSAFDSGDINENTVNAYANLFYPCVLDNGGSAANISLTVDILNYTELQEETKEFPNKNWISENRLQNNLSISKAIWGFKEAFNGVKKSRAISNAICFSGQELTFYISPQGHGTGTIDGQWIYCKTSISIRVIDVVNNTNSIIYSFDDFDADEDDSSRYFNWTTPSINQAFFDGHGMFGLNVISMDITQSYYQDAERKVLLDKNIPYQSQSLLQLLIYSGAKEIIEVNGESLNILTSTPSYSDSLESIFSKTIFENLSLLNQNSLTDAQKRAIVADQIAVLFISQHPVITSDFYPGKVIGAGASASVPPRRIIDRVITYSKRYPKIIPMVKDRLFGMMATYKAFNFGIDIERLISDYTQSSQITRDPVRAIYMDSDGVVAKEFGIDGIAFDPYAVNVAGADAIIDVPNDSPIDIVLQDGMVDIQNILITAPDGSPIGFGAMSAKVGFSVVYGEANISKIRYEIFTQQSMDYDSWIDATGLTRSHIFNLNNPIIPKSSKRGDIVVAQIDIEDINGGVTSFIANLALSGYAERPQLYDLKICQRSDGSDLVDIFYTYDGIGEINNAYLYVQFSDDGINWSKIPTTSLRGDFEDNIVSGRRRVTWNPVVDLNGMNITSTIFCRLTLYDVDAKMAQGDVLTGALVWDIGNPEIALMKTKED